MTVKFFLPGLIYKNLRPHVDLEMQRVLLAGDLILREDVEKFEKNLAKFLGVEHVVAVASGTDALFLSLKALNIQPGDECLIPGYTFRATAEAVHHAGGIPKTYDLGEKPEFTENTKFWIPAHIAGEVPDWLEEKIEEAKEKGIKVIEDACQAIGAAPVRGVTACYSFYPAKILGCFGDGGAIATNSEALAEMLKKARNHFKGDWKPYGWNSRLDNLQAAVLNVRLPHLNEMLEKRRDLAEMYDSGLKGVGLSKKRRIYQDYIITHPKRDELYEFLKERGIETMKNGYDFPEGLDKGPNTLAYEAISLRLPCTPEHTRSEIRYVIENINEFTS